MKEKMTIRSVYEYTVKSIKMCAAADKGAMLRESFDKADNKRNEHRKNI